SQTTPSQPDDNSKLAQPAPDFRQQLARRHGLEQHILTSSRPTPLSRLRVIVPRQRYEDPGSRFTERLDHRQPVAVRRRETNQHEPGWIAEPDLEGFGYRSRRGDARADRLDQHLKRAAHRLAVFHDENVRAVPSLRLRPVAQTGS